jgi:hypothetical protein
MKTAITSIIIIVASLSVLASDAQACSCAVITLEQQLAYADYAFAGTVVDVDTIYSNSSLSAFLIATVAVEEVWKGDVPAQFKVWTRSSSASCGYNDPWARFEIGEKFVLYANEPSDDIEHVYTTLCTRNATYADAGEDLVRLGKASTPLPVDGADAQGFSLDIPHPHPIKSQAALVLSADRAQHVTVEAFDTLGRRVAVLFDGHVQADSNRELTFDADAVPPGLYLIRARGATASTVQSVVVRR